jgi:hypothetical protein
VAYTAPSTRASGYVVTATNWNSDVVDNALWLGRDMPHARVYNSANISVANSTNTALTFNSERYDTGATHSTSSNTSRLTVPSGGGGVYHIGGCAVFASNATGVRALWIQVNGATRIAQVAVPASSATDQGMHVSCDYLLAAGDYVELACIQTSGGALNVTASANYSPEFWFRWVAAS